MKKILTLLLIVVFLAACNLPFGTTPEATPEPVVIVVTATTAAEEPIVPVPTEPPAPAGTPFSQDGVSLVIPECMPISILGLVIPALPYSEEDFMMDFYPQHVQFDLMGYPLSGKFFDPIIRVYPADEFSAMNEVIGDRVTALQTMLANQPAGAPEGVPFLPLFNAGQVFRSQVRYLSFQNGSGVRFLTEFAQYSAPVNNHDLIYSFQGLTTDGKYWISAIFPVTLPYLQEAWDSTEVPMDGVAMPAFDSPTFETDIQNYYATMTTRLEQTANDTYLPSLSCLDALMMSMQAGE